MDKLFYISFATSNGFLGATVIDGEDEMDALNNATNRKLNPGGEAAILPIPKLTTAADFAELMSYRGRLVGKDELVANGAKRTNEMLEQQRERFKVTATFVYTNCNE
jgi:hypothetical protein